MNYKEFLQTKKKSFLESGFEINESELNGYGFKVKH